MATQFRAADGQFAFLRWFAGRDRGPQLELVTHAQADRTFAAAEAGATFEADTSDTFTLGDLLEFQARGALTFGEMSLTLDASEAAGLEWQWLNED